MGKYMSTTMMPITTPTSVISAGYYLYVVMVMFMKPRSTKVSLPARAGGWTSAVVWASAAIILIFGLFPDALVSLTQRSTPAVGKEVALRSR